MKYLLIMLTVLSCKPNSTLNEKYTKLDNSIKGLKISTCDLRNTSTLIQVLNIIGKKMTRTQLEQFNKWSLRTCTNYHKEEK